jgi:hypothetical protein
MRVMRAAFPLGALRVLLIVFAAIGCDDDAPLVAEAAIEVEPASIAFGAVRAGESRAVELAIRNLSPTAELVFERLELAEGTAPGFTILDAPARVAPRGEARLRVRYEADDDGADAGHLRIVANDPRRPEILVPLSAEPIFPELIVEPAEIDAGDVAAGDGREARVELRNQGLAPLRVRRVVLRTDGFAGEPCRDADDCREGRCARSSHGPICALPCDGGCAAGFACSSEEDGSPACRELDTRPPPRSARGFEAVWSDAPRIEAGASAPIELRYRPGPEDRGSAALWIETDDPGRPVVVVPLRGRPENLPPIAEVRLAAPLPSPLGPGSSIALSGEGSRDPEGSALEHRWIFVRRPEGSRAGFSAVTSATTSFTVDLPGRYVAGLEVRDDRGLTSTNEARVEVEVAAGRRVELELSWTPADADLDLHLVRPGAALGSVGDCFFDNPTPDWPPAGPDGDPRLSSTERTETIAIEAPADGVYTIAVRVSEPSPRGAVRAELRVRLDGVDAARFEALVPGGAEQWDVATLTRPSGRLVPLGTVR